MNKFGKHFLTLLGGNSVAFLIQFAAAPILTRLYAPEDFGVFANVMAIVGLLVVFSSLRYDVAIVKAGGEGNRKAITQLSLRLLICSVLLSAVLVYFNGHVLSNMFEVEKGVLIWAVPSILLLTGLYGIAVNVTNSQGRYRDMSITRGLYAFVVAVVSILLGYHGYAWRGLLVAVILAFPLAMIWLRPALREMFSSRDGQALRLKEIAAQYDEFPKWNMPLAAADSLNQEFLFNLVFSSLFGLEAMGLYAITWRYVRAPIKLVKGSVSQVLYREMAGNKMDASKLFKSSLRYGLLFSLPLFCVLFFFGPQVFSFVLGEKWSMAGHYASALSPALALSLISGGVSTVPLVFGKQKAYTVISIFGQFMALLALYLVSKGEASTAIQCLWAYSAVLSVMYVFFIAWFSRTVNFHAHD